MKLYEYVCSECDGKDKPFYTWFPPAYEGMEEPAFCPCCGEDGNVHYKGEIDVEVE